MDHIIGLNNRITRIPVTLAVDIEGEPAFDENGKPIKGAEPVVLQLPRLDCITRAQLKTLITDVNAVDDLTDEDGKPLSDLDRQFEVELRTLRPFVTEEQFKVLSDPELFSLGQMKLITVKMTSPEISLPELLASTNSSKSSARQSNTTSSKSDSA